MTTSPELPERPCLATSEAGYDPEDDNPEEDDLFDPWSPLFDNPERGE